MVIFGFVGLFSYVALMKENNYHPNLAGLLFMSLVLRHAKGCHSSDFTDSEAPDPHTSWHACVMHATSTTVEEECSQG